MSIQLWVFFTVGLFMADGHADTPEYSCLLQRTPSSLSGRISLQGETCAPLHNHGTFFTVQLCVGTPEQCFDVVADTGSDSVIVPSCICAETPGAGCTQGDKCFRGSNRSSTFSLPNKTKVISMTFGSGTVEAAIATDIVSVGDLEVNMKDGVLLMVNRAALRIAGDFQGILGLGVPKGKKTMPYLLQGRVNDGAALAAAGPHQSDPWKIICSIMPRFCSDTSDTSPFNWPTSPFNWPNGGRGPGTRGVPIPARPHGQRGGGGIVGEAHESKLFLQKANVNRFSMCFRDGNHSGALRLDLPPFASPIQNIGVFHWGLDFRGLSVGPHDDPAPAETIFCGPETLRPGMASPCGIIPDSGTTFLTGPKEQVLALETSICSKWERCRNHSNGVPSSKPFRQLLLKCGDWLTTERGLHEIPSFFFHVQTGAGKPEAFELTAWAWVTEMNAQLEDGSIKKVCTPSFGPMEYFTKNNGPIWIFGTPLFYEYDVGYDMSSKQISLRKGKCESCSAEDGPVSLNDDGVGRWPRAVHGEPRIPYYDVDLPL